MILEGFTFSKNGMESKQDYTDITHGFDLNTYDLQIGDGDTI